MLLPDFVNPESSIYVLSLGSRAKIVDISWVCEYGEDGYDNSYAEVHYQLVEDGTFGDTTVGDVKPWNSKWLVDDYSQAPRRREILIAGIRKNPVTDYNFPENLEAEDPVQTLPRIDNTGEIPEASTFSNVFALHSSVSAYRPPALAECQLDTMIDESLTALVKEQRAKKEKLVELFSDYPYLSERHKLHRRLVKHQNDVLCCAFLFGGERMIDNQYSFCCCCAVCPVYLSWYFLIQCFYFPATWCVEKMILAPNADKQEEQRHVDPALKDSWWQDFFANNSELCSSQIDLAIEAGLEKLGEKVKEEIETAGFQVETQVTRGKEKMWFDDDKGKEKESDPYDLFFLRVWLNQPEI